MCVRKAVLTDINRIAEILIFTKRMAYRNIFQNDEVSFNEMQVVPYAQELQVHLSLLDTMFVYDDGIIKGVMNISFMQPILEIQELYVDTFFQHQHIGKRLMTYAKNLAIQQECDIQLWVLEKNNPARAFYKRAGFYETNEKRILDGSIEILLKNKES